MALGVITERDDLGLAIAYALGHPREAAQFLRRHRVVGLGLRRLSAATNGDSLPPELDELHGWRLRQDQMLEAALEEIVGVVDATGVPTLGIKGLSMRQVYEDERDRDIGDIDVMVDDVDGAWVLAASLRALGYDWCQYEWPWIKRDPDTGKIYGQFQLWQDFGATSKRFDIHFGGYSIRHCRRAPCQVTGHGFGLMDPVENIRCLLGNAAGDFLIRLKDVNDVTLLLAHGLVTEPEITREVRQFGLDRFWSVLTAYVRREANPDGRDGAVPRRGHLSSGTISVPFGAPSFPRRVVATTIDAWHYGMSRRGVVGGIRTAIPAFDYYRRNLRLSVGRCQHREDANLIDQMSNETCIRLIPKRMIGTKTERPSLGHRYESGRARVAGSKYFTELRVGNHSFVAAADELFVPTILYDLCEAQVDVTQISGI